MELLLLGTAAAEAWPAPFCMCDACQEARRRGGANIRSRSGALIDNDLKIDYSADTVYHMQRTGRSLVQVRTILFTHHHSDHIDGPELLWAVPPYTNTPPKGPVAVFGNEQVLAEVRRGLEVEPPALSYFDLKPLQPLQPVTTPTGDTILPLPADHAKGSLLFRITRGGKNVFYGHDSGLYPQPTLDALSDGVKLDIAVMDCTNGGLKTDNRGHMGVDGVVQMTDELRRRKAIGSQTRVIATHFSHNGRLLHEELVRAFMPHGIEVAFDGMVVKA